MKTAILATGTALLALATTQPVPAQGTPVATQLSAPEIAFTEWRLDNGLRVIALPDASTRTVYTSVWYDVGSKNDPEGRSGFAHMFEHILSRKTQNMPYNLIYSLTADVGGTRNASTSSDRTNYFEIVPAEYLETMLWTHKERMALPVVDEEVFESERGVVKEEFRTRVASQPYGPLFSLALPENGFDTLPQRRPTIGSIEQLDSAQLGDALAFHEAYYGPDSATLIVAGNFEIDQLRALVDKYFADIPRRANPVSADLEPSSVARTEPRSIAATNPNVPLPVVGSLWKLPPAMHPDMPALLLLDGILGTGDSSRLQERLVRSGIAVDKVQLANPSEEGGYFATLGFVSPAGDQAAVKAAIDAELASIRETGVTAEELAEARNEFFAARLNSRETARGRAGELGEALYLSGGDPRAADKLLTGIAQVKLSDIQRVARTYLDPQARTDISYQAGPADPDSWQNPVPMPEFITLAAASSTPLTVREEGQREAIPGPLAVPTVADPELTQTTLANGIEVVAAQTGNVPIVTITAVLPGGAITDARATAGVSTLAATLADQGTSRLDARGLAAALESLGANLSVSPGDEGTLISVNAPAATIERAGALLVEVLRDAAYPQDQFAVQQKRLLDSIVSLRTNPSALPGAISAPVLYGDAPYGIAGNEETIARITPADLVSYRQKWWRPDTMQLVMSGGLPAARQLALARSLFGDWQASGDAPTLPDRRAGSAAAPRTIVVNLPDAGQATVVAAVRAPERGADDYFDLSIANAILGGGSSGRLFEEIRTKRSLSYGAYSNQPSRVDEGYLTASSQTANETVGQVVEVLLGEFDRLSSEPFAQDLVEARRRFLVGSSERQLETSAGFNGAIAGLLRNGLEPEEALRYAANLGEVSPDRARQAAASYISAENATLIIAGDASIFLDDLRAIRPDVTVIEAADLDFADPLGELDG